MYLAAHSFLNPSENGKDQLQNEKKNYTGVVTENEGKKLISNIK